ncbi:trimethylamine methyltransferase family protein [Halodesulfurarchaeum sp. HSR-GB]|uniref:trimethylamine methyltransferase family protein n=1 Tax=Halodesulfurarchaeum sp. HSR-GB TaxID=3074077 RepID=UPI00285D8A53|nr:trimethylamine methyltransferase family protein [Halodesulfurarchaeum sp. HSR-GB]MDR5656556.1 trimethylamine methyltransferase family protein [Halodesulfurarchaeum sp. HSR-GB]
MTERLSPSARESIHEAVLDVLATAGMRVEHAAARETLIAAGGTADGDVVTLPPAVVRESLESAPSSFDWRARDPDKSVTVGEGDPVITPTRGPRYVKRPGEPRHRATMDDFERLAELVHMEPTIDVAGYDLCSPEGYSLPGNPGGFDQAEVGYELLETLFLSTDKPIVATARSGPEAAASLETARTAFGEAELSEHVVLGILHARSPRVFNEPMVEGLIRFARAGQPLVVASGAIPGASAPHSLSEAAVQVIAETVFGAVLVQQLNPGTPVVLGRSGTIYDPQADAVAAGSPRGAILQDVVVEMADFYAFPSRGSGAGTDAKAIDYRSGAESTAHLTQALDSGADLLLNATGGLDTYATVSPEKTVLDAERIRALRQGATDGNALLAAVESGPSIETIRNSEPGTPFFDDRDPATLADATTFEATIGDRGDFESWAAAGSPTLTERATERVETLLGTYERPPIDPEIEAALEG